MNLSFTIKPFGHNAILLEWAAEVDVQILHQVLMMDEKISQLNLPGIIETTPSYNSITIHCDQSRGRLENIKDVISNLGITEDFDTSKFCKWKIPVCYEALFALDRERIESVTGLSFDEIVELHCSQTYTVFCLGFLPGFTFMGKLHKDLSVPRRSSPRLRVPKGSVGITGLQTGIYPMQSPGGWNIIGRSPINFFAPDKSPPCFLSPGDSVEFVPISADEFKHQSFLL